MLLALGPGAAGAAASEVTPVAAVQHVLPRIEQAGTATSADVYAGSLEQVQQELDPQAVPASTTALPALSKSIWEAASPGLAVDLVVMHGEFTDTLAKTPPRAGLPAGQVMAFAINPKTDWVLETYVGSITPGTVATAARRARPSLDLKLKLDGAALSRLAKHSRHRRTSVGSRPRASAATWGNKCSQEVPHHCYALATWEMHGREEVAGTEALQYTEEADVPTWEEGGFVDQEEWVGFHNGGSVAYWAEMGQAAGEYVGCCTMRWFWAYKNASGYHESTTSETFAIGRDEYSAYFMLAAGDGKWCWDIGPYGEIQVKCVGGFETNSKELQNGSEYAANRAPTAWGHGLVNWWKEQKWYRATLELVNEFGVQSYNGMCISKYAPVPAPGNVNTGSYGHC